MQGGELKHVIVIVTTIIIIVILIIIRSQRDTGLVTQRSSSELESSDTSKM